MDQQMDALARSLAGGVSRRKVLRKLGIGGAAAGAVAVAGLSKATSGFTPAAEAAPQQIVQQTTTMIFEMHVLQGENAGTEFGGSMVMTIQNTGGITGQFTTVDDRVMNVSGTASGRSLSLVFDVGDGTLIFGTGTAAGDPLTDRKVVAGTLTTPGTNNIGVWSGSSPGATAASCGGCYATVGKWAGATTAQAGKACTAAGFC
jgi:hypothetical protein